MASTSERCTIHTAERVGQLVNLDVRFHHENDGAYAVDRATLGVHPMTVLRQIRGVPLEPWMRHGAVCDVSEDEDGTLRLTWCPNGDERRAYELLEAFTCPLDERALRRVRAERPDLADIPDATVRGMFVFAHVRLSLVMENAGMSVRDALAALKRGSR